jgi:hypothetical protein
MTSSTRHLSKRDVARISCMWSRMAEEVMLDLANVVPDANWIRGIDTHRRILDPSKVEVAKARLQQFREDETKKPLLFGESNEDLLEVQMDLRELWDDGLDAVWILRKWDQWTRPKDEMKVIEYTFKNQPPIALPASFHLRSLLAHGFISLMPRLAHCPNPECPRPYFLRHKSSQRFCGEPECSKYAQRKWALASWHKNKKKWRAKKRGSKA